MVRILLTVFVFALSAFSAEAQRRMEEGKVIFSISYRNLTPEMERTQHLLPQEAVFYFKREKTRMEMKVGAIGKNSTIRDTIRKENIILLYLYGKKFALIKHDSDLAVLRNTHHQADSSHNSQLPTPSVLVTDTIRKIAGIECRKAIVTRGSERNECWFTESIAPYTTRDEPGLGALKGFMLEYSATENGITMTMTAKLVQEITLDDHMFSIPEDYKVVTEEELSLLMQVMQEEGSGN